MKVSIERINEDYLMEAKGASGVPVLMDNSTIENVQGASPMELLLMGVGGCSAIDIINILKKQRQVIKSYKVEIEGETREIGEAKPFKAMILKIYLEGDMPAEKVIRAAALSFEKYCSVSITLQTSVEINYQLFLNGEHIN
ncbi:putative redox protein [Ancylomarina subtilis]|uniref:Putative redox protein n=1 Tax=Ancylomarina subtilis TaxID=1639035 RepID=A0A4Q7VI43_9BACT|nr:OsmC family protein [Ancylomarina subtilis]RZT95769.1 putative redox protein [Ancylomarina subtilis]